MSDRFDPHTPACTRAYEELRPELEAMPEESIVPIRHDIFASVVLALGAIPNARKFRRRVVAEFGEAAAACFDRLERVARAAAKAQVLHLVTLHGTDVEAMAGRLAQVRAVLALEVQALVQAGVLRAAVTAELVGGTSYKGLALDVLQLTAALRQDWAAIEDKTRVTMLELDQAEALATEFSSTVGENELGASQTPTADMRRRAYTLFVRTYDEVRRFVAYFRWKEDDADDFVPPLGAGRRRKADAESDEPVVPAPASPIAPGMPGAPAFGPA